MPPAPVTDSIAARRTQRRTMSTESAIGAAPPSNNTDVNPLIDGQGGGTVGSGGTSSGGPDHEGAISPNKAPNELNQLGVAFERILNTLMDHITTSREREREEREAFRADLVGALDRMASANTNTNASLLPDGSRGNPTPHLPSDTTHNLVSVCNNVNPIWKADLTTFSGEAKDVQSHLATCELAFKSERIPLTDEQKILVSLKQCTEGAARAWYETSVETLISGAWGNKTWEDYKVAFTTTFGNPFLSAEGNRLMASAVQREDETTSKFLLRFEKYRSMTGMMDPTFDVPIIRMLRDKLPPKVCDKGIDTVTNYDEFKARVIKQDNKLRDTENSKAHFEKLRAGF